MHENQLTEQTKNLMKEKLRFYRNENCILDWKPKFYRNNHSFLYIGDINFDQDLNDKDRLKLKKRMRECELRRQNKKIRTDLPDY